MKEGSEPPNIWVVLSRSVPTAPATAWQATSVAGEGGASAQAPEPAKTRWERIKWRVLFRVADAIGLIVWTYITLKLLSVDVDRELVNAVFPSAEWILGYRLIVLFGAVALVALFLWRWITALMLTYVIAFPLTVLFWKIPSAMIRRRSWVLALAALNALAIFARNLRYFLLASSLAMISGLIILLFSYGPLLGCAAVCLILILLWSITRVVSDTFSTSWFLSAQQDAIHKAMKSSFLDTSMIVRKALSESERDAGNALNSTQLQDVSTKIQTGAIANKGLIFWAYRLQEYRRSQLSFLFNGIAYASLFIGSWVAFSLVNIAVLKIDASQFKYDSYPSTIAMFLYGLSTLVLNEGGGVSANGDVAYLLRLAAGLFGVLFLATFLVNLLFTFREKREDEALKATVRDLRAMAREHEADSTAELSVSIEEAFQRLNQLGLATFAWLFDYFRRSVPPAVFEEDSRPA